MTNHELTELVRAERLATIELLETLSPEEWATRSLCAAWTVQSVAAHLAWAPVAGLGEVAGGMIGARFLLNEFIADSAVRWSGRGREAILEQLRDNAARDVKPIGMPRIAALSDAVVHALDLRRPLARPRAIPPQAFVRVAGWQAGLRWPATVPIGGSLRSRLGRVTLVADDVDWSWGEGPVVRGSSVALMLLLTGRPVEPDELSGPGTARLARHRS
jgi:uncharacterized protein (TIGR03083 family)